MLFRLARLRPNSRLIKLAAIGLLAMATLTPNASGSTSTGLDAVTSPRSDVIYLGVTQHPAPWDMSAMEHFQAHSGSRAAIVSYFVGFRSGNRPERDVLDSIRTYGALPMITWEWRQLSGLDELNRGVYDRDIRLWAEALRAFRDPVLLRWGHEMNGSTYPWSAGWGQNSPEQYVKAWRRIVTTFRQAGANNVLFVWSPNIIDEGMMDFREMFPGDEFVDWLALDGYNWSTRRPWRSFSELFGASYRLITGLSGKPLMIAEWGSTEDGGDKGLWLRQALSNEIPNLSRIRAVVYFNQQYEEDWRIQSSEAARHGFNQGVQSSSYRGTWP